MDPNNPIPPVQTPTPVTPLNIVNAEQRPAPPIPPAPHVIQEAPKPKSKSPLVFLIMAIFFTVLGAFGFWAYQKYFSLPEVIEESEGPTPATTPISTISPTPTASVNPLKPSLSREEMLARGIHPDPVDIKVLDNINIDWEDLSVAYNLEKIYLTPDIADLGSSRENTSVKNKGFLILQLSVRDRRTSGERRQIQADNYLRLRLTSGNSTPIVGDYLYLSPQEDGVVYVTFAVEKEVKQFSLLIGMLANPRVFDADFNSTSTSLLKGVFLLKQGFAEKYEE